MPPGARRLPICVQPKGIALNRSIKITPLTLDPTHLEPVAPIAMLTLETVVFGQSELVPNNPRLPVLIYRDAIPQVGDMAAAFEDLFDEAGWEYGWRREWHNVISSEHRYRTGAMKHSA